MIGASQTADEMSRAGRPLSATHRSTRSRSLRVSLSTRNKLRGETASLTIQLDNPDEMIDKVLQVLSARFPVDTFFNVIAEQPELQLMNTNINTSSSSSYLLTQALQNPNMVAQILPEELRAQWLAYAAATAHHHHQIQSTTTVATAAPSPPSGTYSARPRGGGTGSVYSSSSSRENTAGVAVVQGAYSVHQDTTTSMEANSSTVSMTQQDQIEHFTTTPQVGAILGATADNASFTAHTTTYEVTSSTAPQSQPLAAQQQSVMTSMTEQFHEGMAAATREEDTFVQHQSSTVVDTAPEMIHSTTATEIVTSTTPLIHQDQLASGASLVASASEFVTTAAVAPVATTTTTTTEYRTTEYEIPIQTGAVIGSTEPIVEVPSTTVIPSTTVVAGGFVAGNATVDTTATTSTAANHTVEGLVVGGSMAAGSSMTVGGSMAAGGSMTVGGSMAAGGSMTVGGSMAHVVPAQTGVTTTTTTTTTETVTTEAAVEPQMGGEMTGHSVVDTVKYVTPCVIAEQQHQHQLQEVSHNSGAAAAASSSSTVHKNVVETVNYVTPALHGGQVYYNHQQQAAGPAYKTLESASGLTTDINKCMMPSISMAVQPSTSPKMTPMDSFVGIESQPSTTYHMNSLTNMVHQTIAETTTIEGGAELVREIRPSPLAPLSSTSHHSMTAVAMEMSQPQPQPQQQQPAAVDRRMSGSSSKSSGRRPPSASAVVMSSVQEVQAIAEAQVYSNEGKWEEWRDDSADKETEHSAKSGSVSHNDDSSFHEPGVLCEFSESAIRRTAEILHSHGCLEQLLQLDASSPIYQQTLHEIANKTDVDLAMINQVFGTSRLQAEFMLWCESMYRPQRYAMRSSPLQQHALSTTTPAQTMPLVTRDFQVIENQMIHTLASPIMTVRTTVTVEPGMMHTHTASTTTTLHRNGEEWVKDTRAVGQLTVTTPAEKVTHTTNENTHFSVTEATPLAAAPTNVATVTPLNLQAANTHFVMSAAHAAEVVADQASPVSIMSVTPTAAYEATTAYTQATTATFNPQQQSTTILEQLPSEKIVQETVSQHTPADRQSVSEHSVAASHHSVAASHHSVAASHHSVAATPSHHSVAASQSHHSVAASQSHHSIAASQSHHSIAASQSHHSIAASQSHHSLAASQSHHSVAASHHSMTMQQQNSMTMQQQNSMAVQQLQHQEVELRHNSVTGSVSHHSVSAKRSDRAGSVGSHHSVAKSVSSKTPSQTEAKNIVRQTSHASSRRSGHQVVSSAMMTAGAAAMRTTETVYTQTTEVTGVVQGSSTAGVETVTPAAVEVSVPIGASQTEVLASVEGGVTMSTTDVGMAAAYEQHQSALPMNQTQQTTTTTTIETHHHLAGGVSGTFEQGTIAQSPLAAAYTAQQLVLTRQGSPESSHKESSRRETEQSVKSASQKSVSVKSASQKSVSVKSASQKSVSVKSASQKSGAVVSASGSVNGRQLSQSSHSAAGGVQQVAAAVVPTGAQLAQAANLIAQQVTTTTTTTTAMNSGSVSGANAMAGAAADISNQLRQTGVWRMEAPGAVVTGGVRQLSGSSHPSFEMQVDVVEETEGQVTDSPAARMVIEQAAHGNLTTRTTTAVAGHHTIETGMVSARAVMESTASHHHHQQQQLHHSTSGERSPITVTRTIVYPRGQPSSNTTVTNVTHNVASWSSVLPQQPRDIVYLQSTSPRPDLMTTTGSATPVTAGAHTTPAKVSTTDISQLAAAASAAASASATVAATATVAASAPVVASTSATRMSGLSRQYSQSSSPVALQQSATTQVKATGGWSTSTHYGQMGRGRGTFAQSPIAMQTQPRSAGVLPSSVMRATSPLAASIGHDRFFATSTHPSGAATTTHITTKTRNLGMTSGTSGGEYQAMTGHPSTYMAYNEWKSANNIGSAAAGESVTHSSSQQSVSKHTTSVMSSKYAPPAAMAQINTSSPLAQLKQENPNPLLEKLALHWTR